MQTLSSKPTSSSLSIPKKPVAFFQNPLERLEISSSENHPLVHAEPLTKTTAKESVVKDSSWEKHLPSSWKPKTDSAAKKTEPIKTPPPSNIPPQEKRRLPDEVKAIFEKNSKNFSVLAGGDEKSGEQKAEKTPAQTTILDEWDRALLFGEYPPEQKSPKRLSFEGHLSPSGSLSVPKKDAFTEVGTVLPTRVMDKEIVSPTLHKETPVLHAKPLSKVSIVPQKPKSFSGNSPLGNTNGGKSPLTPLHIPTKPKTSLVSSSPEKNEVSQTPKITDNKKDVDSTTPPPTMSETLVGKIIEGQMRGVFENAPPLLQKNFEKTLVYEILTLEGQKNTGESIENEVWKKRLREYLLNLQGRAVSAFPDPSMAQPTENELVLDYVKRVYPVLLRS